MAHLTYVLYRHLTAAVIGTAIRVGDAPGLVRVVKRWRDGI